MGTRINLFRDRAFDDARDGYPIDIRINGLKQREKKPPKGYSRCKICGGMVKHPCVLCHPEEYV